MKREVIECDVCGKAKQEANHWYVLLELMTNGIGFSVYRWPTFEDHTNAQHICGQECVQKFVSNWMNGK